MYQAITTKYLASTNTRGTRVKATAQAGSVTVGWDHNFSEAKNYHLVAEKLARSKGWRGVWFYATMANQDRVYVWVPHLVSSPAVREQASYAFTIA